MTQKKWAIQEILNAATEFLRNKGIESPRLCAEVLLSHQLKKSRVGLYLEFDQPLSPLEIAGYRSLIRKRLKREPLQYITGHQEFWSLDFLVSPAVLIPRPETELLVEEALKLKEGGLLSDSYHNSSITFDMIISNPPYIPSEAFKTLPPEVRYYEPRVALDGQKNGMHFIKRIIEESGMYLKPDGWLLIEMDPNQTERALYLIDSTRSFSYKERLMDYRKKYRMVKAQKRRDVVSK